MIFKNEPNIIGKTIMNENLAANSLLIPNRTEEHMVNPLLEIPGIIAIACENPIRNDIE